MKNIAIIGGQGFIGKNFSHYFLSKGYSVTIIGRNAVDAQSFAGVTSINSDIRNTTKLVESVKNSEVVVWLASTLVPGSHESSLELDFDSNIKPIISFLENLNTVITKKFIYLSSGGTIYGDTTQHNPISETQVKSPISEYGLSKLIIENYIEFITRNAQFESFVLRPSNVYGKFQNLSKPQGIIGFAFKSLINNSIIDLYDDGKVVRDFVSVDDVAEAVLKCVEKSLAVAKTNIYNVGSGKAFTIKEMIKKIGDTAGIDVKTTPKSSRNFDCQYNVLSIEKIKNELNWEPVIDLDEGLKEIWSWIKKDLNG